MGKITQEQLEVYLRRAEVVLGELHIKEDETFPSESNTLEKCILHLRRCGWNYSAIQRKLGSIPKDLIRQTLLKYTPELITIDTNYHKIPDNLHKDYDWNWEEFKRKGQRNA